MRNLFLTLALVFSFAVSASSNIPLVFIHGIKGSELVAPSGEKHWLTSAQVLGFGPKRLQLPFSWNGDVQGRDDLLPGEILKAVTVVPFLFEQKIYGPWLQTAQGLGRPFYPFAYDWRRDCNETLDNFEKFIRDVRAKNNNQPVQVVGHSMGGLITLALLNEHPEHFQSAVLVGVPFRGAIGFLPDVHAGRKTGLNGQLLTWETFMTFPSVLNLLPAKTEVFKDSDGKTVPADLSSIQTWKALGLGYYAKDSQLPEGFETFFAKSLAQSRRFRERLAYKKQHYPPLSVIVGKATPTLQSVVRNGPKPERGWDFTTAATASGDGRILEAEALPPSGFNYQPTYLTREHSDLLSDPEVSVQIVLMGN